MIYLLNALARLAMRAWAARWVRSSQRIIVPTDAPLVHAPGVDPSRLLLVGEGFAMGWGVLSHDMAVAGHLARRISALTDRATDIEIIAEHGLIARRAAEVTLAAGPRRFDAIILTLGYAEAFRLHSVSTWERELGSLLDRVGQAGGEGLSIFLIEVPLNHEVIALPNAFDDLLKRQINAVNAVSHRVSEVRPRVTFIPFDPETNDRYSLQLYDEWAAQLAPTIADALRRANRNQEWQQQDEMARQQALERLRVLDSPASDRIDHIVEAAQNLFGSTGAAVTLLDGGRQWMKSVHGMTALDIARNASFCNVTIQSTDVFVVEDATSDHRFRHHPSVVGDDRVRFYAGYPLEAPDGHRVGALCITDRTPRTLSRQDAVLLREFAHQIQRELWEESKSEVH